MAALNNDMRQIPTVVLLGAAGLLVWTFWFDPLSVEDVSRWWSLPSGANWAALAAALGSLIGGTAMIVIRRDQPLPLGVLIVTLMSAAIGAILVSVDWILTKIASDQLIIEGSHAQLLTTLVVDASAALWLGRIGWVQQRRSREQLLSMTKQGPS